MTQYVVFVHEKGKDGFVEVGKADANTPDGAIDIVLTRLTGVTEGTVGAVPARSWKPKPFKLVSKPTLELG